MCYAQGEWNVIQVVGFFSFLICTGLWLFFPFCFPTLKIKDVGSLKRDRWENSKNSDSESCFWCLNYPEKVKWSSVVSTLGAMMNDESVCVWECVLQRQQERQRERVPFCSAVCVGKGGGCCTSRWIHLFLGLISESHHHCLGYRLRWVINNSTHVIKY